MVAIADETAKGTSADNAPRKKRRSAKRGIVCGVVAAIAVLAIGLWVWHNDPSFCNNTVCHEPMDPYVETFYQKPGAAGTDKWGNEVSDTDAMLVTAHAQAGLDCLDCHVPDIRQQAGEVAKTISGDYTSPLDEVSARELMANAHRASASRTGDEFCMNDACHSDLTREELTRRTSDLPFNPHAWQHEKNQCTDCHKSHRASVLACTECHDEAREITPDGWVDAEVGAQIHEAIYQ